MSARFHLSRRRLLKGAAVAIGLPPLEMMFDRQGIAYAAERAGKLATAAPESRFVLWFNGNGVVEKFWIPTETGPGYQLTPCLSPLAPFRSDVHIITGLDNPSARMPGPGNDHHRSMSSLVSGTSFTGRGAGGPSVDQVNASKIGGESRFRSLQIGVSQESHGGSINRNMSWAAADRPLPPEEIPHKLFDRIFGAHDEGWTDRKRSILDTIRADAIALKKNLPREDSLR